jgi:uncharacterized protein (TIGR00730 family)
VALYRTLKRGDMHERKALMAELSDSFIALPSGIGTLEETFEVWTWAQLGPRSKPCALPNIESLLRQWRGERLINKRSEI